MPGELQTPNYTTPAAIQGGSGVIGGIITAIGQGRQNRLAREHAEKMYNQQKADNLEFWNLQNQYNSPEEQMRRLRQAGLNPNLVYGNGQVANQAESMKAPNAMQPNIAPFRMDLSSIGDAINTYNNLQTSALQRDNLRSQIELQEKQKALLDQRITDVMWSAISKEKDVNLKELEYEIGQETKEAKKQMPYATLENWRIERNLKKEDIGIKQMYRNYQKDILETQLAVQKANMDKTVMETNFLDKSFNYRLDNLVAGVYNKRMATDLMSWKRDNEAKKGNYIQSQIDKVKQEAKIREKDEKYYETGAITNAFLRLLGNMKK